MGDLFWNKVAGVVLGAVLAVLAITELGHLLVPTHAAHELTAENTAYPVDWDAIGHGAGAAEEPVEQGPTDYGLLLANADIGAGERAARRCAACHTFNEGGANGVGPNLWDAVGNAIAAEPGFSYSAALQGLGADWTYEALDGFIENPNGYAPGTNMSFRGLSDLGTRIDLIAYLRSLSNDPQPLPDPLPEETEGEAPELDEADPAAVEDAPAVPAGEDAAPQGEETAVDVETGEPVDVEEAVDTIENPEAEALADDEPEQDDE